MPGPPSIRDWAEGDDLSAGHWQESIPVTRSVQNIFGGGETEVFQSEHSTSILTKSHDKDFRAFHGIIGKAGPSGEADLTDPGMYWVQIAYITAASPYAKIVLAQDSFGTDANGTPFYPNVVPVCNLPEAVAGSRSLSVGTPVFCRVEEDRNSPNQPHWTMSEAVGIMIKIVSTVGGSAYGKYNVNIMNAPIGDVSITTAAAEADFGTVPSSPKTAIAINTQEIGNSVWDLAASGFVPLIFRAWYITTNADKTIVLGFDGSQWENCT